MANTVLLSKIAEYTSADIIDTLAACGPIDPTNGITTNSLVKQKAPELFPINLHSNRITKEWLREYADYRQRSPILTADLRIVDCSGSGGTAADLKMTLEVLDGSLMGSAISSCSSFPADSCTVGTCATMIGNQSTLNVDRIDLDPKRQTFGFAQCLNTLVKYNEKTSHLDLIKRGLTGGTDEARTLATFVTRKALSILEDAVAKQDFLENTDKGALATVVGTSGSDVILSDTAKIEVFQDTYLHVFRPDPTAITGNNPCLVVCGTGQTWNYRGTFKVLKGTINRSLQTAQFMRPLDLNTTTPVLLPAVTVQAGDVIFASSGDFLRSTNAGTTGGSPTTGYFAGTAYFIPKPYPGLDVDNNQHVSGTYTGMLNCCLYNSGFHGLREIYDLGSVGGIAGGSFWTRYSTFLKPKVICCGTDEYWSATERQFYDYADHAATVINQAIDYEWFPALTNKNVVVMARRRTMDEMLRNILTNYSEFDKVGLRDADGRFVINPDPSKRVKFVLERDGINIEFRTVNWMLEEGQIYIGPDVTDASVVFSDLGSREVEQYSKWNLGRVAREAPTNFLSLGSNLSSEEFAARENQTVFYTPACAGTPAVMNLAVQASRYMRRIPLLGGAATLILNAAYKRPYECDPNCVPTTCDICEI